MAWTTITEHPDRLDEAIADFEATVTSIDNYSVAQADRNQLTAVVRYTA